MENASKALLIAASILIAIILIAFGVRIISSTQGTTDSVETTMNATEITMFNNKFLAYCGEKKSATIVRNLIDTIMASNATSNYKVNMIKTNLGAKEYNTTSFDMGQFLQLISSADTYYIRPIYSDSSDGTTKPGYIYKIEITK